MLKLDGCFIDRYIQNHRGLEFAGLLLTLGVRRNLDISVLRTCPPVMEVTALHCGWQGPKIKPSH